MTPDDALVLRSLAGIHFRPEADLILPSGLRLTADEANVCTSYYMPADGLPDRTLPEHLARQPYVSDIAEVLRLYRSIDLLNAQARTQQAQIEDAEKYGRQMWIVACFFAGAALVALALLLWALLAH